MFKKTAALVLIAGVAWFVYTGQLSAFLDGFGGALSGGANQVP